MDKVGATLHIQSSGRFEMLGNMHFVVEEGKEVVGNMHFVVVEGKEVVGIVNLEDNSKHYSQVVVVIHFLVIQHISYCKDILCISLQNLGFFFLGYDEYSTNSCLLYTSDAADE